MGNNGLNPLFTAINIAEGIGKFVEAAQKTAEVMRRLFNEFFARPPPNAPSPPPGPPPPAPAPPGPPPPAPENPVGPESNRPTPPDNKPPSGEHSSTTENPLSQKEMISRAQFALKMDIETKYNFAVCGDSGSGKSTFINCIRDLDDVDEDPSHVYTEDGPAPSGLLETTQETRPYVWPKNQNPHVVLWDMPGGGTVNHPAATYFSDKVLYAFDCLLVFRGERLTEVDVNIIKGALKYKRSVAVVISKADVKVQARMKPTQSLKSVIETTVNMLKTGTKTELARYGIEVQQVPIYVISASHYRLEQRKELTADNSIAIDVDTLIGYCIGAAYKVRGMFALQHTPT